MDSTPLALDELKQLPAISRADLPLARALTYRGREVEVVKVGIALMSLGHEPEDRARLLTIARDDQYTRNVFWTLSATEPGRGRDLLAWEIARLAYGPGRQWALDLISDDPPPGYKRWLVCEGFRTYRDDYGPLAQVAIKGDLASQLAAAQGTDTRTRRGRVHHNAGDLRGPLGRRRTRPDSRIPGRREGYPAPVPASRADRATVRVPPTSRDDPQLVRQRRWVLAS